MIADTDVLLLLCPSEYKDIDRGYCRIGTDIDALVPFAQ